MLEAVGRVFTSSLVPHASNLYPQTHISLPITLADLFRILLEFSCQPIKQHTGHFRHCFSGML